VHFDGSVGDMPKYFKHTQQYAVHQGWMPSGGSTNRVKAAEEAN